MKPIFKLLSILLGCVVIFCGGFYFAIMLGGIRRGPLPQMDSYIPLLKPIDFDVKYILPEDRWILNYHVFLVPLDDVESKRSYALVVLRPIGSVDASGMHTSYSRFFITGLADENAVLAFSLLPDKILSNPNFEYVHLLEVTEGLLSKPEIQLPESARLVSSAAWVK